MIRDWDLGPAHFTWRPYGEGDQGWYDPVFDEIVQSDHQQFYQINVSIPDPIIQEQGKIYWLDISVDLPGESELGKLGWKTSLDHFEDDAVYWDPISQAWIELRDPLNQEISLDMAFVVSVPEPGTWVLLGMGLLGVVCISFRKRGATR